MATRLKHLQIREVSLVDRPANVHARVLLAKRDFSASERRSDAKSGKALPDGSFPIENAGDLRNAMRAIGRAKNPAKAKAHIRARASALGLTSMLSDAFKGEAMTLIDKIKAMFKGNPLAGLEKNRAALAESIKSIVEDDSATNKQELIDETLKQFAETVDDEVIKALATGIVADDTSEEDEMSAALLKALGLADTATEADVLKAIGAKDEAIAKASLEAEIAKAGMSDDECKHHDALKSDDERKAFRALAKADRAKAMTKADDMPEYVRKALDELAELKKRNATLEAEREADAFAKRAEGLGLPAAFGEVLRKATAGGDKDAVAKLEETLKGMGAVAASSDVFKEFGALARGETGLTAYAELEAKAEEARKADPKLSKAQAIDQVWNDPTNAELRKREKAERGIPA